MIELQRIGMSRRALALLGAGGILAGTSFGLVPPAVAAAPHDVPAVQSVALESSQTSVTSSTSHKLHVQINANQNQAFTPGAPTSGSVSVDLSNGTSDQSEFHEWQFADADGALDVDSTGAGKLTMTNPQISPFGKVNLTITPIGNPTTTSCQGTPTKQVQNVSLAGTFYFDTQSTGKNAWGTVGKKSNGFTFAATNTITTTYINTNPSCLPDFTNLPCTSGLFWQTDNADASMSGVKVGSHGSIFASRTTDLSAPAGAKRVDEAFGTSKPLVLSTSGSAASLSVKASSNGTGSAKLSAKKHGKPFSSQCKKAGKSKVETSTTWSNAKYKNGSKPLSVKAQIFGSIKVANNSSAEIVTTKLS